jgi:hypothetical protein
MPADIPVLSDRFDDGAALWDVVVERGSRVSSRNASTAATPRTSAAG